MNYDCIIVGAGPTGAVLGGLLARAGHSVLLLERDQDVYALPRAVHMDHEIMRVLQQLDVLEALRPYMHDMDTYRFENAAGEALLESRGNGRLALSGYVSSAMFVQPELERLLRVDLLQQPNVTLRLGALVGELTVDESNVTVSFESDGTTQSACARYVVGCDGASSFVRRTLAIPMDDLGFDEPWAVVDMLMKRDIGLPENAAYQFCDPRRPTTCVPGGPGRRRWEFMLLPGESREDMGSWDAIWPLLERWGGRNALEPIRLAVYRFHALIAARWRVGRVLLAGDAAHQTPPFMGQGLCSGLRDAANLAWKLHRVLAGSSGDALLDTYEQERAPHIRHVVETSVAMGRVVCERDPERVAQRDAAMKAALAAGHRMTGNQDGQVAPLSAGVLHSDDRGAGWLFPQPMIAQEHGTARLDTLVGCGTRLFVDDAALLPSAAELQAADICPVVLGPGGLQEHGEPSALSWLEERGVHAALVRPDHYTYVTATDRAGVEHLTAMFSRAVCGDGALPR